MRRWASTLAEVLQTSGQNSSAIEQSEICEYSALLLLDSIVKKCHRNPAIMEQVVDRLESRYFSTGISTLDQIHQDKILEELDKRFPLPGTGECAARTDFVHAVDSLPLTHKVRIVLSGSSETAVPQHTGGSSHTAPSAPSDPWKKMDPVDMEDWEKKQFLKGEEKVKRTAYVEAKPTPMKPGQKLRSLFALQMLEQMPSMSLQDLMLYTVSWTSKSRFFRGDLQTDAQEAVIRRLLTFDKRQLRPYTMVLCAAASEFTSPSAVKLWLTRLIPALIQMHGSQWTFDGQKLVEHIESPFIRHRRIADTPRSLCAAQLLYSFRKQTLTQELIDIFEDWITECDGWTMRQVQLTCHALRNVRRTRIHDKLGAVVSSLHGSTTQWAELAVTLEGARPEIWERAPDLVQSSEDTMLMFLRSMRGIPSATESFAFQDLQDAFRRRNQDIPTR